MNETELQERLEELRNDSLDAATKFARLQGSGNKLSNDLAQRKAQIKELNEARLKSKVASRTLDKFETYIANKEAQEAIDELVGSELDIEEE